MEKRILVSVMVSIREVGYESGNLVYANPLLMKDQSFHVSVADLKQPKLLKQIIYSKLSDPIRDFIVEIAEEATKPIGAKNGQAKKVRGTGQQKEPANID